MTDDEFIDLIQWLCRGVCCDAVERFRGRPCEAAKAGHGRCYRCLSAARIVWQQRFCLLARESPVLQMHFDDLCTPAADLVGQPA